MSWLGASVTIFCLGLASGGCGEDASAPGRRETQAADTVQTDTLATVVPFHGLALRIAPVADAEAILEASAGTPLRVLEARSGWLRVATWDGRAGWVAEAETFELALWVHYQEALGGAPLSDLRPAYPLADGHWAVEAPFPSGMTEGSNVWVGSEPASVIGVETIAEVPSACGPHRMAILADRPAPLPAAGFAPAPSPAASRTAGGWPAQEQALLAAPGAPSPRLRRIEPMPVAPDPSRARIVSEAADRLLAAHRGEIGEETLAAAEWTAIGEGALWVRLAGEARGEARQPVGARPREGSWAGSLLVLGSGSGVEIHEVVSPYLAPDQPALRLLHAFATGGSARPTLFVVERLDSSGPQIELYAARAGDVRRLYAGYAWGC